MPRFSFKEYVETKIFYVNNKYELYNTILEQINSSYKLISNKNIILILFTLMSDTGTYECRIWVYKDKIQMVCNSSELRNLKGLYKVMLEKFVTSPVAAAYDAEVCQQLGFKVHNIEPNRLAESISSILGLEIKEKKKMSEVEVKSSKMPRTRITLAPQGESGGGSGITSTSRDDYLLKKCFGLVWRECAEGNCILPEDPKKALEEKGFAIIELKGDATGISHYLCMLRTGISDCSYAVVKVTREQVEIHCFENIDNILLFLEEKTKYKNIRELV